MPASLGLIYLGGTIGCHGQPLTVLPADQFVPRLLAILPQFTDLPWEVLPLPVMDSSQVQPVDWATLLQQIATQYAAGMRHFLILHGTDTLAYTAALLAEAAAYTDLHLVVTGSQYPLLSGLDLTPDPDSDALDNLRAAVATLLARPPGVWVTFNEESWPAQTVQKIHTRDRSAFSGHRRAGYPAVTYKPLKERQRELVAQDWLTRINGLIEQMQRVRITTLMLVPQPHELIAQQLESLIALKPDGIILMAYGLGNLPQSEAIKYQLKQAKGHGVLVVLTTQTPYGGTEMRYAAGSWLEGLIMPAARLTLPAIYGRLVWLCSRYAQVGERRRRWSTILNDERMLAREDFRV